MIDQEDIHNKCLSNSPEEKINALDELKFKFSLLPDQELAWNDLHRLTSDEKYSVRSRAASALSLAFPFVPNKQQAWNDLHRLATDKDRDVRFYAAEALGSAFSHVPDQEQAWNDLHRLAIDKDRDVRYKTATALGFVFSHVPDQEQAWNDLRRLATDKDRDVRFRAASALSLAFPFVPNKQRAWNDLYQLATDKDRDVRYKTASALSLAFPFLPNKQQAWNDLHRLTNDKKWDVRSIAASALGSAYPHILDKQQALDDLRKLTNDKKWDVRSIAASALGSAYPHILDKQQALDDLCKLTNDKDIDVRAYANHSLGKVSIFKASQAEKEEDYKQELEKAIIYFEKAAEESNSIWSVWDNPSQFCLPFYRSFHTIIFKKQEAKEEVDKYLEEAKDSIKGSKSKEMLFKAVENLANALKEVQNIENLDFEAKKDELNVYRQYCARALELLRDTEKAAPFATVAMKKGLPILDRNLTEILEEIQKKTDQIRRQTKGTPFEQLGDELNRSGQLLLQVRDPVGFKKQVQHLENKLSAICSKFPESQKGEACELLKTIKEEQSIEDKIPLINDILSKFSYQFDTMNPDLKNSKKSFIQKISHLIQSPLGTASALAACVYPLCEIYDIKNQHVIFLTSFGVIFVVIYIIENFKK